MIFLRVVKPPSQILFLFPSQKIPMMSLKRDLIYPSSRTSVGNAPREFLFHFRLLRTIGGDIITLKLEQYFCKARAAVRPCKSLPCPKRIGSEAVHLPLLPWCIVAAGNDERCLLSSHLAGSDCLRGALNFDDHYILEAC